MDEVIERMIVSVRADTRTFEQDVAKMRGSLEDPLVAGADKAGRAIETALLRAVRTGKFGFDDLRRLVMSVLDEIAAHALRAGLAAIGGGGGVLSLGNALLGGMLGGAPGRATGGPVVAGRPYRVGENGPEYFVPGTHGRIETGVPAQPRDIRILVNVQGDTQAAPQALARSGRQIARSVRRALTDI